MLRRHCPHPSCRWSGGLGKSASRRQDQRSHESRRTGGTRGVCRPVERDLRVSRYAGGVTGSDELVDAWLPLPDIAERTDLGISKIRRFVEDRSLVGVRRGDRDIFQVPELFLGADWRPLKHLRGTLITLHDAGFDDEAAIVWLFTPDPSLPGRPIDLLRDGNKTEVRRRAQAMAL